MIIFLDLDGVIINWAKGVCNWFDVPYEPEKITRWNIMPEIVNVHPRDFWPIINTPVFWEYLDFYPEAISFIERLQQYGEVILMTSPAHGCAGYRQNWIQKNLPTIFNKGKYILTPSKYACAHKGAILIDDHNENCQQFSTAGGHTILYPQPWNQKTSLTEKEKNDLVIRTLVEIII